MAYIAVNSTANFVRLDLNADGVDYSSNVSVAFSGAGSANVLSVPALQEVTVNATPGTFNWQQLDSLSELVVTTPSTNSIAGLPISREPPHLVAIQLNTLIPVGTAIIIVAAVKYARVSTSRPTVYM